MPALPLGNRCLAVVGSKAGLACLPTASASLRNTFRPPSLRLVSGTVRPLVPGSVPRG